MNLLNLSKLKALALITLIFVLGAIAGASLSTTFVSRELANEKQRKTKVKYIDKLRSRLQLTPDQTAAVDAILKDTYQQFEHLHLSVKPQFEEIRHRMRDDIRAQLNESQKAEFEAMVREYDERRSKDKSKDR